MQTIAGAGTRASSVEEGAGRGARKTRETRHLGHEVGIVGQGPGVLLIQGHSFSEELRRLLEVHLLAVGLQVDPIVGVELSIRGTHLREGSKESMKKCWIEAQRNTRRIIH